MQEESPKLTLARDASVSFTQSLQQSKKPSLLPSTSFRAASQLPRYSKFSLAMTTISSPLALKKQRSGEAATQVKKDAFAEEREVALAHVMALGVAAKGSDKEALNAKCQFLKDEFWKKSKEGPVATVAAAAPASDEGSQLASGDGGYKDRMDRPSDNAAIEGSGYKDTLPIAAEGETTQSPPVGESKRALEVVSGVVG
jgi:type IV secretory pathway VirJ component